jgi:putative peptide zinc metalloprotease protein
MRKIPVNPQLRKDLVIIKRKKEEQEVYTIKDPIVQRFYEVGHDEYRVMRLLNGNHSWRSICDLLPKSCDIQSGDIEDLLRHLNRLCLLESSKPFPSSARLSEYSLFRIRLRLVNPKPMVSFLAKYTGFLITLPSLIVVIGIIAVAVYLTTIHITPQFYNTILFEKKIYLVAFYLISAMMMTLHEFGHAIACKRFKGDVREMGIMLLCLLPCFYTDVSDIYLIKEKHHRITVIAAGPLVELTLWALCTIAYFLYPNNGVTSYLLYIGMMTSGLKSLLVNFNPLIKVDGYYLLEEILDCSNLMENSYTTLGLFLKNLRPHCKIENADAGFKGRRSQPINRTFLVYGIISMSYSLVLMGGIFYFISDYFFPYIGYWSYPAFYLGGCLLLGLIWIKKCNG